MSTTDIITIIGLIITSIFSTVALVISLISLISNHFWKKYENHLLKKKIIRDGLDNFTRQVIEDYFINSPSEDDLKNGIQSLLVRNFTKNKSSLVILLNLIKEKILEEKKIEKSVFWCRHCGNFYNAEGIKLICAIVSSPIYGGMAINGFY